MLTPTRASVKRARREMLVENCMVEVGWKSGVVKEVREVECAVLGPKLSEEGSFIPSSMHTCVRPSYLRIAFSWTLVSVLVKTT